MVRPSTRLISNLPMIAACQNVLLAALGKYTMLTFFPSPYDVHKPALVNVVPNLALALALPHHTTEQVGSSALRVLGLTGQRLGLGDSDCLTRSNG